MVTAARATTLTAAGVLLLGLLTTAGLPAMPVRRPSESVADDAHAGVEPGGSAD